LENRFGVFLGAEARMKHRGFQTMLKGILSMAAFGALALGAVSVQAAPVAPASPMMSAPVVQVAEGCGQGYHRNRYGVCRRNTSPAQGACWFVRGPAGGWRMVCK
jgi:hypothetical protein